VVYLYFERLQQWLGERRKAKTRPALGGAAVAAGPQAPTRAS